MAKKKYHKTSTVIASILALAVVMVLAAVFFIYNQGLRYVKTDTGVKFFGFLDRFGAPDEGRFWYGNGTVVSVERQDYFIIELGNPETAPEIAALIRPAVTRAQGTSGLDAIDLVAQKYTADYPNKSFVFNLADDNIRLHNEEFFKLVKDYEILNNNNITGGFITTLDGRTWLLSTTKSEPSSYKDFEITGEGDKSAKYNGDIFAFIGNEKIVCAMFDLKKGGVFVLAGTEGVVRLYHERGDSEGDVYIGGLNRSLQKNVDGIYWFTKVGEIYRGSFADDKKTGHCAILYSRGDTYAGDIVDNRREGLGVSWWSDGTRYAGEYKNDMKNGQGESMLPDGTTYTGTFVDDVKQGKGKIVFSNGDLYEGDFVSDMFNGKGKYFKTSGEYYEGDFKDGMIHGEGTYHWTSGRKYTGYFDQGKMTLEKPAD